MPKKKNAPVKTKVGDTFVKKIGVFKKSHKLLFILVCLALVLGIYQAYRQVVIYQERKDFQAAERVVSELVDDIQAELGKTKVEEYRQCSYGTIKFEKKNLGCGFEYSMVYQNVPQERSNMLAKLAYDKVFSHPKITNAEGKEFKKIPQLSNGYRVIDDERISYEILSKNFSSIKCYLETRYFHSKYNNRETRKGLDIGVRCHSKDNVMTNYYPMVN